MLLLHQRRVEQMAGIEPAIPVRHTGVSPQHFTCEEDGEQMAGIEPAIPAWRTGVSPQHFTCGGVPRASSKPPDDHRRARRSFARRRSHRGPGGNRTHVLRFKKPVQRQRLLPTQKARHARGGRGARGGAARGDAARWSHPLESNQDLPGFGRARRPHAQGWGDSQGPGVVRLADRRRRALGNGRPRYRAPHRSSLRLSEICPAFGQPVRADLERDRAGSAAQRYRAQDSNLDLYGSEPSVVPSWTSPVCGSQTVSLTADVRNRGVPRSRTWRAARPRRLYRPPRLRNGLAPRKLEGPPGGFPGGPSHGWRWRSRAMWGGPPWDPGRCGRTRDRRSLRSSAS